MDFGEKPLPDKHDFERFSNRLHVIKHYIELVFEKITGKSKKYEYDATFLDFLLQFALGKSRDFIPKRQDDSVSPRNDKTP